MEKVLEDIGLHIIVEHIGRQWVSVWQNMRDRTINIVACTQLCTRDNNINSIVLWNLPIIPLTLGLPSFSTLVSEDLE